MSTCRCYNLKVGENTVYWYVFDNKSKVYVNSVNKFTPCYDTNLLIPDTRIEKYFSTNSQLYITIQGADLFADRNSIYDIKI